MTPGRCDCRRRRPRFPAHSAWLTMDAREPGSACLRRASPPPHPATPGWRAVPPPARPPTRVAPAPTFRRDRRLATGGHDLRLETLRQHHTDVVPDHVPRLLLDEQRRLQHVTFGCIFGLDKRQLIW